jgi:hypothetical protein
MPFILRPLVHRISRRYIAGGTLEDAVRTVQHLNEEDCAATVDILGEDIKDGLSIAKCTAWTQESRRDLLV